MNRFLLIRTIPHLPLNRATVEACWQILRIPSHLEDPTPRSGISRGEFASIECAMCSKLNPKRHSPGAIMRSLAL